MPKAMPCPKCKNPLEIPKPRPERLACASCGASIKIAGRKPGEETRVPTGESTLIADPATARNLTAPLDAKPSLPGQPAPSTAGLKIGIAVAVLLVAGLGGLAAYFILKEPAAVAGKDEPKNKPAGKDQPKNEPAGKDQPKNEPAEPEEDSREPVNFGKVTRPRRDAEPKPVDPRVKKALDDGVRYLRRSIPRVIDSLGLVALIGLTLLECDVPVGDPDVQKLATHIRSKANQLTQTYPAALAILFLDRLHRDKSPPPEDRKLIRTLALRLIRAGFK